MDARAIETRLREIAGGADMITVGAIAKYMGFAQGRTVKNTLASCDVHPIGRTNNQRYFIADVAKALAN